MQIGKKWGAFSCNKGVNGNKECNSCNLLYVDPMKDKVKRPLTHNRCIWLLSKCVFPLFWGKLLHHISPDTIQPKQLIVITH